MGKSSQVGRILLSAVFVVGLWLAPLYVLGLGLFSATVFRLRSRGQVNSTPDLAVSGGPRHLIVFGLAGIAFLGALLFCMRSLYNYLEGSPLGHDPICFAVCVCAMAAASSLDRRKSSESDVF